jgi:ABC-2 type transport system permease protein
MKNIVAWYATLLMTSFRSAASRRLAFLFSVLMMVINNLLYFVTWWIIYQKVPSIGGWEFRDMQLLFGISACSFGLCALFFNGSKTLSEEILQGGLDTFLMAPRNVMLSASSSRCDITGLGDIISGIILFSFAIHSPTEISLCILFSITGAIIMFASVVLFHSIAFWISELREVSDLGLSVLLILQSQPGSLFTGMVRFIMFTIIPAGFVATLPVQVIRTLDPVGALLVVVAAIGYLVLASWIFSRGLLRYESGSRIELGAHR